MKEDSDNLLPLLLIDCNISFQMFNRPGPRLVDALEFLTGLLNDEPGFIPEGFPWEVSRNVPLMSRL